MIFLRQSLVWKELCFDSGRDWFLWNSALPKSIKLTVSGLASGEKYPGAMLLDFLSFLSGNCSKSGNSVKVFTASRSQSLKELMVWFHSWTQISEVSEQIQLYCVVFWLNLRGSTTSCFKIEIMRMCVCGRRKGGFCTVFFFYIRLRGKCTARCRCKL